MAFFAKNRQFTNKIMKILLKLHVLNQLVECLKVVTFQNYIHWPHCSSKVVLISGHSFKIGHYEKRLRKNLI